MQFRNVIIVGLYMLSISSCAQIKMSDYAGNWKGELQNINTSENPFNLDITIKESTSNNHVFLVSNTKEVYRKEFKLDSIFSLVLDENIIFKGIVKDEALVKGHIQSHGYFYPVQLHKNGKDYTGKWNLSAFQYLQPKSLSLTIQPGNGPNDPYSAYPILGSFWCNNFQKQNNAISFTDYLTGLQFEGKLTPTSIELQIGFGENKITEISYKRAKDDGENYGTLNHSLNDGWETVENPLVLSKMEADVLNKTIEGTEGVVVAKHGKIIYEHYFNGFSATTPHDTRSASKSVYSSIIGLAIDDGIIESVDEKLYDFIPQSYRYTKDALKSEITIKDLLTMSSGIAVSEDTYQESDNWLKTVLEPPLDNAPRTVTDYKSADPYLTGIYLKERLESPVEDYIAEKLFAPLNISNYLINTDDSKETPYFGGGLRLTPRDMLKFGQLYLNKGIWNGQRVISEKWVNESFTKHTRLENVSKKNEYGYLWWHYIYNVNGTKIESIEARGAGGQYIFVIPALDCVAVITSGNYRNGKTRQPEKVLEEYILPEILKN